MQQIFQIQNFSKQIKSMKPIELQRDNVSAQKTCKVAGLALVLLGLTFSAILIAPALTGISASAVYFGVTGGIGVFSVITGIFLSIYKNKKTAKMDLEELAHLIEKFPEDKRVKNSKAIAALHGIEAVVFLYNEMTDCGNFSFDELGNFYEKYKKFLDNKIDPPKTPSQVLRALLGSSRPINPPEGASFFTSVINALKVEKYETYEGAVFSESDMLRLMKSLSIPKDSEVCHPLQIDKLLQHLTSFDDGVITNVVKSKQEIGAFSTAQLLGEMLLIELRESESEEKLFSGNICISGKAVNKGIYHPVACVMKSREGKFAAVKEVDEFTVAIESDKRTEISIGDAESRMPVTRLNKLRLLDVVKDEIVLLIYQRVNPSQK